MRFYTSCVLLVVACWVGSGHGVPTKQNNITFVLSAKDLPTQDDRSHADPFVKLYSYEGSNATAEELNRFGTTDVIVNKDSPVWHTNVYWFLHEAGKQQKWRFVVVDHDILDYDDVIGQVDVDVDNFVRQSTGTLNVSLSNGGSLKIQRTYPIVFKLRATNLPPKDRSWWSVGLSDPYVECYYRIGRNSPESQDVLFYTTQVITDVESPVFDEIIELPQYVMNSDLFVHFKLWDADTLSGDDFLGETNLISTDLLGKRQGSVQELLLRSNGRAQLSIDLASFGAA